MLTEKLKISSLDLDLKFGNDVCLPEMEACKKSIEESFLTLKELGID